MSHRKIAKAREQYEADGYALKKPNTKKTRQAVVPRSPRIPLTVL